MSSKWGPLFKTLPIVGGVVALRFIINHVLGFSGFVEFSDVGLVLTGGIFLIGFMLSGVMSDYKESEKIPAELACTLEAISSTLILIAESKGNLNAEKSLRVVRATADTIVGWLYKTKTQQDVFAAIENLEREATVTDKLGAGSYAGRVLSEVTNLRKTITRMGVVSRTNFLPVGDAMMQTLGAAIVILLFMTKFKSPTVEWVLTSFVSLIFFYMIRLIHDIDDPFEYSQGSQGGSAEVALFPLTEYMERLDAMTARYSGNTVKKAA